MKKGFTLLELIVSIGIFAFVLLSVTGIFQQVINVQRKAFAAQDIEESIRFAFEIMSKEIRTAERNFTGECANIPNGAMYAVGGNTLYFQNQADDCVAYFVQNDGTGVNRLYVSRTPVSGVNAQWPITPNDINISNVTFTAYTTGQPAVNIRLTVAPVTTGVEAETVYLQTTISSRYYLPDDID